MSPASTVRTSAHSGSKSRPGSTPLDVLVGLVRAGRRALEAAQRLVGDDRHPRADRPDEAGDGPELRLHLVLLRRAEVLAEGVLELDLVQPVVPAGEHEDRAALVGDHRERLDQRAWRHAELPRHGLDRGRPRGVHGLRRRAGEPLDRLRRRARHLDVGGVAGGRQRDVVLARGARRHVLVRAQPAHHPDVRLDPVPLEPAAVEDAVVGLDVQVVAVLQAVRVAVERVGVLHDELARPQDARARARLVPLLDLDVVEDQRQVAVGAHHLRDVHRHVLLVRHGEHQVGAPAVLEAELLVEPVAPAALPQLGGLEHRHQHLLRADRVELLAHDLLGAPVHPQARGQPRPEPRADLADEARPDHQLVRERLRVRGRELLGGQEVAVQPGHAG